MINIRLQVQTSYKELASELQRRLALIQIKSDEIGEDTSKFMKNDINQKKVRPQEGQPTTLENNIDTQKTATGWGVGEIAKLNANAKHWKAVNYGSNHMVGQNMPPYFTPGKTRADKENFREGRVNYGGQKGQGGGVPVTNPIPPMNYITDTINYVRRRFRELGSIFRGR